MEKKIRRAIIPEDGIGTRVLPEMKEQSKDMLSIVDKQTLL